MGQNPSKEADILSSLFDDTSAPPRQLKIALDAATYSFAICHLSSRHCTVVSALVKNNNLLVVASQRGHRTLLIFNASLQVKISGEQVPLFANAAIASHDLSAYSAASIQDGLQSPLVAAVIPFRPPVTIVCTASFTDLKSSSSTLQIQFLHNSFFQQLFGLDFFLSHSSVALIGCQNGYILYFDTQNYCNSLSSSQRSELRHAGNIIYSLDQPVVGIHALDLPTFASIAEESIEIKMTEATSSSPVSFAAANSLIFVGSQGKLVLCHLGENEERGLANFIEFQVPGPIISSTMQQGHFLSYSTPLGIYKICLRSECIYKSKFEASQKHLLLIPHMQFRFPTLVSSSPLAFLLNSQYTVEGTLELTTINIAGTASIILIKACSHQQPNDRIKDGTKELKEAMKSIQFTSQQTVAVEQDLARLNHSLAELNEVMSLLLLQTHPASECPPPFVCKVHPTSELVGVGFFAACVDVELLYSNAKMLGKGWSLVVHVQDTNTLQCRFHSIPLENLSGHQSLKQRIKLDASVTKPLSFTITSSIHYCTASLQVSLQKTLYYGSVKHMVTKSTGLSIHLSTCVIDALDFIQPLQHPTMKVVQQMPNFAIASTPEDTTFSLDLTLPFYADKNKTSELSGQYYSQQLSYFLPPAIVESGVVIITASSAEVRVGSYVGHSVDLKVKQEERKIKLTVSTSTAHHLAELVGCIQRRIKQGKRYTGDVDKSMELLSKEHAIFKVS